VRRFEGSIISGEINSRLGGGTGQKIEDDSARGALAAIPSGQAHEIIKVRSHEQSRKRLDMRRGDAGADDMQGALGIIAFKTLQEHLF
jgi:hypothetical protein